MGHERFQKCIQLCMTCAIECRRCAAACINEDDVKMLMRCILLSRDCAALCDVAVSAMGNENPLTDEICDVCADMCDACAEECEKHKHNHCKRCAEVCRQCADECRRAITPATMM
jgi:hypothetical protein